MPFAVVLGEDELAAGKVKIKEMGLREGHPEKEGVLVDMSNLTAEVQHRLSRKKELDDLTRQAEGLRVVHGIKGSGEGEGQPAASEEANPVSSSSETALPAAPSAEAPTATSSATVPS